VTSSTKKLKLAGSFGGLNNSLPQSTDLMQTRRLTAFKGFQQFSSSITRQVVKLQSDGKTWLMWVFTL